MLGIRLEVSKFRLSRLYPERLNISRIPEGSASTDTYEELLV